MVKNYSRFALLMGVLCLTLSLKAQINITAVTGGTSICVGGGYSNLSDLTIEEAANGAMTDGAKSYIINAPTNFEFDNSATLTYSGTTAQITGISRTFNSSTQLTIDFTVSSTAGQIDRLVVQGLSIRAINAPAFGNITSSSNSIGVSNTVNHGSLFSIAPPTVSITNSSAGSVCTSPTDNTTFNAYGASSYEFFIDGVSVQGPSALSVLNYHWNSTAGAPHNVYVRGTSNGCTAQSSTIVVNVFDTPTLTWTPSDQSFGLGDPVNTLNFNGSFVRNPTGGTITFSGNGVSQSGINYVFSPAAAGNGTHNITAIYTRNGCTATDSEPFVVSTANSITGLNSNYCNYSTGNTITITPPSGKTVLVFQYYNWLSATYSDFPAPEYTIGNAFCTFSPLAAQSYSGALSGTTSGLLYVRVVYTDGTTSPLSFTLVYDRPSISVSFGATSYCANASNVPISIFPLDNGQSFTQVMGTGVSETAPGSGNWILNPSVGGTGPRIITYQYRAGFSPNCENTVSTPVTITPPPTASITTIFDPVGYCTNSSSFALSGNPTGGIFTGPGTFSNFNNFYPGYNTNIGTNTLTYTYTDPSGCSDTDTRDVTVFEPASISISVTSSDTAFCLPLSGNGTYTIQAVRGGPATDVSWTAFNGSIYTTGGNAGTFGFAAPSTGNNAATLFTNSSFQATSGVAYIQAITTGQPASCPAASRIAYAFLIPPPIVTITNLPKDRFCTAEPNITLTARATYKYPDYLNFPLSTAIGDVTNIASVPPGDPALAGVVFQPGSATPGPHDIRYTYTDPNGCTNDNDTTLIINENPIADFIVDSGRCATRFTYFNAGPSYLPPATTVQYRWDFGDGTSLADTAIIPRPNYRYTFPGGYPVSLTLRTSEGCSDTKTLSGANLLTIQRIPRSNFDFRYQCDGDVTVFDTLTTNKEPNGYKNRTWIFLDNTNTEINRIVQPVSNVATTYTFPAASTYSVILIDSTTLGCTDRIRKPVFILPFVTPTLTSPYFVNFKTTDGLWGNNGINNSWVYRPIDPVRKPLLYDGGNGVTGLSWITSDTGSYNVGEKSHIHSPCFNFANLDKPMISIRMRTATQEQIAGAVLSASTDNGITWNTIGRVGDGLEWYNNIGIAGSPGNISTNDGWSGIDSVWRQARIGLNTIPNFNTVPNVRLRITFGSPGDSSIARSEGIAIDSVWVGNKNKILLLEHFTNTSSTLSAANAAVSIIRDTRKTDVAPIFYHSSVPSQDVFNDYYPPGPSSRVLYYGVPSTPRTILDGTYYNGSVYTGTNADAKIDVKDVDARSLETARFKLDMTTSFVNGSATVATEIKYINTPPFSSDIILHTVITEDSASGNNNYSSVVRQMLPDPAGTYVSRNWAQNDSIAYSLQWTHTLPTTAKLNAVTFIQDASTKEIYQAAYIRGSGTFGSPVIASNTELEENISIRMFPNPASDEVFFLYGKTLLQNSEWVVYDNMGRVVTSGTCSAGKEGFSLPLSGLANGLYHVKLQGHNGATDYKELVVIH